MKKVIITGSNGYIGSHVVNKLLERGYIVYGVDVSENIYKIDMQFRTNYRAIVADFSKYDILDTLIEERDFECFYHFAWQGGFQQERLKDYKLQYINAEAVCDAFVASHKLRCCKFVYAGTINEVEIKQFINNENFVPRPTCIYATAKLSAELICRTMSTEFKMEFNAAYIPMIYGVGNKSKQVINVVIKSLLEGKEPKLIEGKNKYDLVHISDIADGIICIGEKGVAGKSYYVGHRSLKTFKEIMMDVKNIINPEINLLFGAYQDPLNLDYSLIDVQALHKDTGFECKVTLTDSLLEVAEWLKNIDLT